MPVNAAAWWEVIGNFVSYSQDNVWRTDAFLEIGSSLDFSKPSRPEEAMHSELDL
jgi:hypothetical protein